MSLEQNFPQVGGPVLDPRGNFTDEWLAFFRALWNRTGKGPGTDPANIAILGALSNALSPFADPQARSEALAALLMAVRPPAPAPSSDDAKLFALSLLRPPAASASSLEAEDEGSVIDPAVSVLNFTGAGITATQTSPGVVQVDVPAGGGGTVTSVAIGSTGGSLSISGAPITTSGTINLDYASIADQRVLANVSGGSAAPTATAFSSLVGVGSAVKWAAGRTLAITGDLAYTSPSFDGSGNVTAAGTLATVNSNVGTFGDSTHVGQFTVNAKGLITAASNVAISGGGGGTPGGSSGQLQYNNAGAFGGVPAVNGDGTLNTSTGVLSVTKTGGVAFAASATTDTTNAGNIGSGVLGASRGGAGSITGLLKANGSGVVSAAASGTDYAPATSGSALLQGNGSGGFSNVSPGANITLSGGVLSATGSSGGTGLFGQILSATPTQSLTGLSNFMTATSADNATGQSITGGGAYTSSVPTAPYSITAMLGRDGTNVAALGWTDGTKLQFIYVNGSGNADAQSNSNISTFAAANATNTGSIPGNFATPWLRIRDDGTTVYFQYSTSGSAFVTLYSVAKSSGYLGSSGYSHIFVGAPGSTSSSQVTTVMSWTVGT